MALCHFHCVKMAHVYPQMWDLTEHFHLILLQFPRSNLLKAKLTKGTEIELTQRYSQKTANLNFRGHHRTLRVMSPKNQKFLILHAVTLQGRKFTPFRSISEIMENLNKCSKFDLWWPLNQHEWQHKYAWKTDLLHTDI